MTRDAPSLTGEAFIERVASLSRRLTRHLNSWDEGNDDAMEDVAGVTRTLLANGSGDKAILRLCSQQQLAIPDVTTSGMLEESVTPVFAMGNVPEDNAPRDGKFFTVSLRDWLASTAIISGTAQRKVTSWNQLIVDFGNTFGAHLSTSVPAVLGQARLYIGPNKNLSEFCLRAAAITAEISLAELLPQVDQGDSAAPARAIHGDGPQLSAIQLGKNAAGNAEANFRALGSISRNGRIATVPFDGKTVLEIDWKLDANGKTGSMEINFV